MLEYLTKSKYLIGLECPLALWKVFNEPSEEKLSPADELKFEQGHLVGDLAKGLYPNGIELPSSTEENIKKSKDALKHNKPLFEAGFEYNKCYARADILVPVNSEWDIVEVKAGTSVKDINLHDLSFQRYVYESSGLKIRNCYLMHLNKDYARNGDLDLDKLFLKEDVTSDVKKLMTGLEERVKSMFGVISSKVKPEAGLFLKMSLKNEYHSCLDDCVTLPSNNVFDLYRGGKLSLELYNKGIVLIKDIPNTVKLNEKQKIQKDCLVKKEVHVDKASIKKFLKQLRYPVSYLDFETFSTAVPLFDGLKPWAVVPFQFSLHVVSKEGARPEHFEFLYTGSSDPRLGFLTELEKALPKNGSVVTFNAVFENGRIKELSERFPSSKKWADSVLGRVVDLLIPFRNFDYYDTKQCGSASIKNVLPALTGKDYSSLDINSGGDASAEFFRVNYTNDNKDRDKVLKNLVKYCSLDTEAMVMIVDRLKRI